VTLALQVAHEGVQKRDFDIVTQVRLSITPDLPCHPRPVSSAADLSLDELRFLRSCDRRWFELSPVEASVIIRAARNLIVDLVNERGTQRR
jgi:hypothetical protein